MAGTIFNLPLGIATLNITSLLVATQGIYSRIDFDSLISYWLILYLFQEGFIELIYLEY